ncbi:MAG: HAMP domain-containing sensor histidine kinase [Anaerovoracaceae bacterium]
MKYKKQKAKYKSDYSKLKVKLLCKLLVMVVVSVLIIFSFYKLIWSNRGGNWIVGIIQDLLKIDYTNALNLYQQVFRNNLSLIWIVAISIIFFVLLRIVLNWYTKYFDIVNQGIDDLLTDNMEIHLPSEMTAIEDKLNAVKQELKQRTLEAQLAEQRKNDLVMYLAHDIRTPLTSVIGYLSLLSEAPDMPAEQKAKYVNITLDKAYRLEKMINEFFEITRYNLQQISLSRENIDLYYMLVQLTDELSPILSTNKNTAKLKADENLTIYGDPDKLARVFNNVLKNAAAYSYPNTEINILVEEKENDVIISFINRGKTISKEKLVSLFEKFYRLDEARTSNTGGAGLGLAIANEIVTLHGGRITANSNNETITFEITLPKGN